MTSGITRLVFLLQLPVCHYLHTDQALQQLSLHVHSRALQTGSSTKLCFALRLKTLVQSCRGGLGTLCLCQPCQEARAVLRLSCAVKESFELLPPKRSASCHMFVLPCIQQPVSLPSYEFLCPGRFGIIAFPPATPAPPVAKNKPRGSNVHSDTGYFPQSHTRVHKSFTRFL
jgi:hypothetical protein